MSNRVHAILNDWNIEANTATGQLFIAREGVPGHIDLKTEDESFRADIWNASGSKLVAHARARYRDLRMPLRSVNAKAREIERFPPLALLEDDVFERLRQIEDRERASTSEDIVLGEWRMHSTEILVGDYRRHCLEIRCGGRHGKIHVGVDDDSLLVLIFDEAERQSMGEAQACLADLR